MQVADSLSETLLVILKLEIAYVLFHDGDTKIESVYTKNGWIKGKELENISQIVSTFDHSLTKSIAIPGIADGKELHYSVTNVGSTSTNGIVVVGSTEKSFPNELDLLILNIACNQANVTIHHKISVRNLEHSKLVRERFVNTLTHDLRTPLTAAKMSAILLSKGNGNAEKQVILSSRIADNLGRANQMIENLLDANSLNAGESLRIKQSEQELYSIIDDTLINLVTIYGDRFVLTADDKSINGFWSPEGVQRIIENLCSNAVKYGDIRHPIGIHLSSTKTDVTISVHNYGNPIPCDEQKRLFDPFQRLNTETYVKGWGLGLSLVKGLVEAHSGHVSVSSSEKDGTTFTVKLPRDTRISNIN